MNLLILGCLFFVLTPFVTFMIMLHYSKLQDNDLTMYEEYEEKIRNTFTWGFIVIPLIAGLVILMGVKCLNINT